MTFWKGYIIKTLRILAGFLIAVIVFGVLRFTGDNNLDFFQKLIYAVPFVGLSSLFEALRIKGLLALISILTAVIFLSKVDCINNRVKVLIHWINE